MSRAGIGRVLVASLHQGIADLLPTRLEFYENWLNPKGLRDGTIGPAPVAAVLSFLREEGEPYAAVTARAGEYAAEWTVAGMSGARRGFIRSMPVPVRRLLTLDVARRLIRDTCSSSRAMARVRRGVAIVDIRGSIFCAVRAPAAHPLCGFYGSTIVRLLGLFGLEGEAKIDQCRGIGDRACLIAVALDVAAAEAAPVESP